MNRRELLQCAAVLVSGAGFSHVALTEEQDMTASSCVNPSLTYMALTAQAVGYAARQLAQGVI